MDLCLTKVLPSEYKETPFYDKEYLINVTPITIHDATLEFYQRRVPIDISGTRYFYNVIISWDREKDNTTYSSGKSLEKEIASLTNSQYVNPLFSYNGSPSSLGRGFVQAVSADFNLNQRIYHNCKAKLYFPSVIIGPAELTHPTIKAVVKEINLSTPV